MTEDQISLCGQMNARIIRFACRQFGAAAAHECSLSIYFSDTLRGVVNFRVRGTQHQLDVLDAAAKRIIRRRLPTALINTV